MKVNEQKFYNALENIFTGAKVEGDSGYVNLLKIKEIYYRQILEKFKTEVTENDLIEGFKEEFFDKLYSFFEKYFSESGSVYFVKTANWQRVYEKVYTDNKDVVLFWKTHMLYYVKSDILFQSINVEIQDDKTGATHYFYFDVGDLKQKQNNEKRQIIFEYFDTKTEKIDDNKENNIYSFKVSYSEKGRKTKKDEILKKVKIREEILDKAFNTFKKQSEVDFFINKNAKKFLTEQLDIYLHQILLHEENKFVQKRLDQIKTIKEYAGKIIDFISQFEDELVKIWNKPKFAKDSNYVITLDKLSKEIIEKLSKHPNLKKQINEWNDLGMIKKEFEFSDIFDDDLFNEFKKEFQYLPIDTKYFKVLEIEILSLFDNLDKALDGRLIHSENYQALNTLQNKYKEKIQCIYIDPPFNTGSDFAYIDNFQDSTWLSLMNDRIEVSERLLRNDGSFYLHLDQNADYRGRDILEKIFGKDNFRSSIVWKHTRAKSTGFNNYGVEHNLIYYYVKNENYLWNIPFKEYENDKFDRYYCNFEQEDGSYKRYSKKEMRIFRKLNKYPEGRIFSLIPLINMNKNRKNLTFEFKGINETWATSKIELEKLDAKGLIIQEKENGMPLKKQYFDEMNGVKVGTLWDDIFPINSQASERLGFDTQKPEKLLERILKASSNENNLILDFFTGSGSTISTAHKLKRKWLGFELGDHFITVILPRMKNVLFGKISGISKELEKEKKLKKGGFFKYYSLEQYEETLRNSKYSKDQEFMIWDANKSPFEQYIFFADNKLADVLETKKKEIQLNFDNLYPNIDLPETISNLMGLPIKKITKESVVLQDGEDERKIKTDVKQMTEDERIEFVRLLKPLLWWGE